MNWNPAAIDFLLKGGLFMIPLGLCSVLALTIIIERGIALRRNRVSPQALVDLILKFPREEQTLLLKATEGKSSLARLIKLVINHQDFSKSETSETLQMQARHEIVTLERGLVLLEIVVGVAPLLGLLGTVSGLVKVFENVGVQGLSTQGMGIARGISEALNTTVAGLVIAIPTLTFWSYYSKKVESLAAEMESLCGEFLSHWYRSRNSSSQ
ncbi:MAG: MotA/TolQ/ExbB proton channel family protein [Verrucomicrobiae bacterium]|nr:MotA/TolQ/ExbB proton channel family protein [Verrucomicrobiae bacterium]